MRLLAVLPALNEEQSVADVVADVSKRLACDVLVVDDGSSDDTARVARRAGAMVLRHPFNLGVGAAVRSGLRYGLHAGYDVVLQVDADGQHDPGDGARLVACVTDGGADLAIGSRFGAGYAVGHLRRSMMRLLARIVSRRLGTTITDTTSGFRAFSPRALHAFADRYPTAYLSDTVEALLLAAEWGLVVEEAPVQMHPRQGGQPSARRIASTVHLLRLFLVILLHPVRRAGGRASLPARSPADVEA